MLKICVLEDEPEQMNRMKAYLQRYAAEHPEFDYTLEAYDRGLTLLDKYRRDSDLLILDIRLPDISGMEAAHRIREMDQNVMILFVTSLTQYAIEGYSVQAFDYILKPVAYEPFAVKLERAIRVLSHRKSGVTLDLRTRDGRHRVMADEITYIEISNHDIFVHLGGKETLQLWGTLSKLEEQLKDAHFARCSSGFLVNLKYVRSVKGDQVMVDDAAVPISRPRRKEFLNALAQYKGGSL